MLPFFPSIPNQNQSQSGNDPSSLPQNLLLNPNMFPNYLSTNLLSNFNGGPSMASPPSLPNIPLMIQNNNQMGIFPQLGQLGFNPSVAQAQNFNQLMALQLLGQACNVPQFQGQLQNPNLLLGNIGLPQNFNNAAGMHNGTVNLQNQMLQGNQLSALNVPISSRSIGPSMDCDNPGFLGGNPHMAACNSKSGFSNLKSPTDRKQNKFNQNFNQNKKFQHRSPMKSHQVLKHKQKGYQQSQASSVEDGKVSIFMSGNSPCRTFTRDLHGFGKREHTRFQKMQPQHGKNLKSNGRPFTRSGRQAGQKNWREGKPRFVKSSKPDFPGPQRRLPVNYTEDEVRQWVEARKKNFPTRINIEKKLAQSGTNSEDVDGDTKLRRQQLKEVLVKQAELGVEVAEIPASYLAEPASHVLEKETDTKEQNNSEHFSNNYNKKRGKHGENWRAKRPKLRNNRPTAPMSNVNRREPTLLQKLLSADLKGDKHRVLQVFRFMVLNSFFEDWPDKPLEFPTVTVKDSMSETEIPAEQTQGQKIDESECPKYSFKVDEAETLSEDDSMSVGDSDFEKAEEGEITK